MNISKYILQHLEMAYSVALYGGGSGMRVIAGSQIPGKGITCSALDGSGLETVWDGPGGAMTIIPVGNGEFLATEEFYRGFNAKASGIGYYRRKPGGYERNRILDLPYLHRFTLVDVEDEKWLVAATLCDDKAFRDDWSKPGRLYAGPLCRSAECDLQEIYSGIFKNHGMYCGPFDGHRQAVLVSGENGVFQVAPPAARHGEWRVERILDREVSEVRVFDLDGDGNDELVTVEGFHGDRLVIYKKLDGSYQQAYSYPIAFGHAVWCGTVFGKPSIVIGYNGANAGLFLLTLTASCGVAPGFSCQPLMIDEHEGFNNLDVWDDGNAFHIYTAGSSGRIIKYTLTP